MGVTTAIIGASCALGGALIGGGGWRIINTGKKKMKERSERNISEELKI